MRTWASKVATHCCDDDVNVVVIGTVAPAGSVVVESMPPDVCWIDAVDTAVDGVVPEVRAIIEVSALDSTNW